jgi:tRNA threonylcarbamoyladenosine biosynthesis protein TsaE
VVAPVLTSLACHSRSAAETEGIGAALARTLPGTTPQRALYVHLQGDLGAGKTTLVRGLLRCLGVTSSIKSPTYGLLETYEQPPWSVLHLDLYRLQSADDLLALGLGDHDQPYALWLIEWPEQGAALLPEADIEVTLLAEPTRHQLRFNALTEPGGQWLSRAAQQPEFSSLVV